MIYVTHDQAEAMALADRVAVMRDGAVQQAAAPLELYRRPANRFVAGFIGSPPMNFFEGAIARDNGSLLFRAAAGFALPLDASAANSLEPRLGQPVTLGLRPEHIADGPGVAALVERVEATGAESILYCAAGGVRFVSRMPAAARRLVRPKPPPALRHGPRPFLRPRHRSDAHFSFLTFWSMPF